MGRKYDVCLSFAGEDRRYVERVAEVLRSRGVRVFYDRYERVGLWGRDLYDHFDKVYRTQARYCVLFASRAYARKLWTNHERRSAQARAFSENAEYILPARFDDTRIPGILETVGYIDLRELSSREFALLIVRKVGLHHVQDFLPSELDVLYERLGSRSRLAKQRVQDDALRFWDELQRMSYEERALLMLAFRFCCPLHLPQSVHVDVDFLRRLSGFTERKIIKLFSGMRSLGIYARPLGEGSKSDNCLGKERTLSLEWHNKGSLSAKPVTEIAVEMIRSATDGFCDPCQRDIMRRLDFAQLSLATAKPHSHGGSRKGDAKSANKQGATVQRGSSRR